MSTYPRPDISTDSPWKRRGGSFGQPAPTVHPVAPKPTTDRVDDLVATWRLIGPAVYTVLGPVRR